MSRKEELKELVTEAKRGFERVSPHLRELGNAYSCRYEREDCEEFKRRGRGALYVPATAAAALKIYTSILTNYFANPDIAVITADDPEDERAVKAALALQNSLRYYIRQKKLTLFPALSREILNACVYLGCALKVYWYGNRPKIDGVALDDLYFDPAASSPTEARYLAHRLRLPSPSLLDTDKRRLTEAYDIYEQEGERWMLSTFSETAGLLRDRVPLKDGLPLFFGRLLPQLMLPGEKGEEIYGSSPMEYVLPLQREVNELRNGQLEAAKLQLEPRYLYASGSGVNPMTFFNRKLTQVSDCNMVKELPPPELTGSSTQMEELLREFQEVTAVTPYNTGTAGEESTATGAALLSQEANQRLNVYTHSLNETLIEPAMHHLAELLWRYGDTRFLREFEREQGGRGSFPELYVHVNTGLLAVNPVLKQRELKSTITLLNALGETELAKPLVKRLVDIVSG